MKQYISASFCTVSR